MVKIAYLCCILDKPSQVKRLINSHKSDISELIFGCSVEHSAHYDFENYYTITHDLSTVERYNRLWECVKDKYTHFAFIGHDCEFSENYDNQILNGIKDMENLFPDKKYMLYPNDGIHGVNLATHPIFTKEWCDALGYFFPQGYMRHCYVDNYMMGLGVHSKRIGYIDIELKHHNPFKQIDLGFDVWQLKVYQSDFQDKDKQLYQQCIIDRFQKDLLSIKCK